MDEKSVRKSHGHHIPPAKGMGKRALLLLGLLSLLTAADEVRHADAQHRATSDPSERHAVEAGQRETRALLVLDGDGDLGRINFLSRSVVTISEVSVTLRFVSLPVVGSYVGVTVISKSAMVL